MKLQFKALWLENFGSYRKQQILNFDDMRKGLWYVGGVNKARPSTQSNGAGKSTLLNAIAWCLSGKTTDGRGATDMKPRGIKGTTRVAVVVAIDDGEDRVIMRTARPNALTIDEKPATQADVDRLIGIPFVVQEQTILLGQERPLFFDLANREKLELLSAVLNLDKWDTYSDKAHREAKLIEIEIGDLEMKLATRRALVKNMKTQLESLRGDADLWHRIRDKQIKGLTKERDEFAGQLAKIRKRYDRVTIDLDRHGTEEKGMRFEINKLEVTKQELQHEFDRASVKIESLRKDLVRWRKGLKDLDMSDTCPTCGQAVKATKLAGHRRELKATIADIIGEINTTMPKGLESELARADAKLRIARTARHEAEVAAEKAEKDHTLLIRTVTELETKITNRNDQLENYGADANPYTKQINELRKRLRETVEARDAFKESITKRTRRLERVKFWVKGFKEVRLTILQEVLQELELVTNSMLPDVGLGGWRVHYDIERDTKSGTVQRALITTIEDPDSNEPTKWQSWSGGEKQRLRIVGALALSQVLLGRAGVNPDLEILDEPTSHITEEGVDDLCSFLAARAKQLKKRTLLVDHVAIESGVFTGSVTVTRTKNGSQVSID